MSHRSRIKASKPKLMTVWIFWKRHTRSNERRASSSRPPYQSCDCNQGTQSRKPKSETQRITKIAECEQRRVKSKIYNCDRRISAKNSCCMHDNIIQETRRKLKHIKERIARTLYCPSRNQAGVFATGEIRQNIKFADFWCVFLTKIKVDPESW